MFKKVAVIGAGTMGAGIAGQVANAGLEVLLLDLPGEGDDVNAAARRGLERLKNPDAPGLMSAEAEQRITLGNIRDDLHNVADCDWVAEAVVERLDVKHRLYRELAVHMNPDAILSSNTSTIPIRLLTDGMDEGLKQRFAITHFFNPVRFMRLLELVRGEHTRPDIMDRLEAFSEEQLGKGVVPCADTPGFLANRVGVYAIQCALHEAFQAGLRPQIADAVFGRPMGIPKTGVFGLYDLIGIDLMSDVAQSLVNILPEQDAFHAYAAPIEQMVQMIANGQTGNKQGKGFYRDNAAGEREVLDFASGEYQTFARPHIAITLRAEQQGVKCLLDDDSVYGRYAWRVLSNTLNYAASLLPEVGDDPTAIDDAMKLGYNWIRGPFELLDEIGVRYFVARRQAEGSPVAPVLRQALATEPEAGFYRVATPAAELQVRQWATATDKSTTARWQTIRHAPGVIRFTETRQTLKPVNRNAVASWYAWEDVALVEFHSKANALDGDSMAILGDAIAQVPTLGLKGLIVHNDAQHFSCGVNLEVVRHFFRKDDYAGLDQFLAHFQQTVLTMARADFPVVAAPSGLSIGGGFEVVLHAQQVVCHANSVLGLVETGVGVIPGGGGCKETLYRWMEQLKLTPDNVAEAAWKAFMSLGYGRTATSPLEARELAMLRANDRWLMNRDRLLAAALERIKQQPTAIHYARPDLHMPGREVYQAMLTWLDKAVAKGVILEHDRVVNTGVAEIITGGDIAPGTVWTEQDLFDAERRVFLKLAHTAGTQARINSMLDLGRTLRN